MNKDQNKKIVVVTLSEQSVNDIADAVGNVMEALLKPLYEEIKEIKRNTDSIVIDC